MSAQGQMEWDTPAGLVLGSWSFFFTQTLAVETYEFYLVRTG